MYYYYGRRNYRYRRHNRTYTVKKSNKYFAPILEDIRNIFNNLDEEEMQELLDSYGEKYGDSAYNYATKTYKSWQKGTTKMSEQTLLRLIETIPDVLEDSERIALLEKLFNQYLGTITKDYQRFTSEWDNFNAKLDYLSNKVRNIDTSVYQNIEFPEQLLELAAWVSNDDMVVAKKIQQDYLSAEYQMLAASALADIERFRRLCNELKLKDQIYNPQYLTITLPTIRIEFTIYAKQKSFFRKLKDMF